MERENLHKTGVHTHKINMSRVVSCRDAYLRELVTGKKVVHLGCADSPFTRVKFEKEELLHEKLFQSAAKLVGVDVDKEAIDFLRSVRPQWNLVSADIQESTIYGIADDCDIVLFPEVIEHLSNPGLFLDSLVKRMDKSATLVITTPNILSWRTMLRALGGKETLHQDHVLAFTPSTITQLLARHGFAVSDMLGYTKGWSPNLLRKLAAQPIRLVHKFNNASVDGLIVHARINDG